VFLKRSSFSSTVVITIEFDYSAATRMPHPKGAATAFSLDVVRQKTLTGELSAVIRIAVAVRKKLQFFYWKKEKFHELHSEVSIPYEPRSIAWCKDTVCVAFMGGYSLIKMNKSANSDSGICELFSAGVKNEKQFSSVTLLSGLKELILTNTSETITFSLFLHSNAHRTKYSICQMLLFCYSIINFF